LPDRPQPRLRRMAPALTLVVLAPLLTEVLPGATRFSSLFVFPIEMAVWGGGALMIREIVRRNGLGWPSMLLLAIALSLAEEFIIQQSSVAPLVVQLRGVVYARAFGINYVYLAWALIYETAFVVFAPIALTELIFPRRATEPWANRTGMVVTSLLFVAGAFFAWFTWTQIARPQVFHLPAYAVPLSTAISAVVAIILLLGLGVTRRPATDSPRPYGLALAAPLLASAGFVWAVLLYGIVVLAFGIAPNFPPAAALAIAALLAITPFFVLPASLGDARTAVARRYWLLFGTILGAMAAGFVGFIGAVSTDLIFKVIANLIAVALLLLLGKRLRRPAI